MHKPGHFPACPDCRASGRPDALPGGELEAGCAEAFRATAGARRFTAGDLRGGALRLYVAHARSCEVHVGARHPVHGTGTGTGTGTGQPGPTSAR